MYWVNAMIISGKDRQLALFCNNQARGEFEGVEPVLFEDKAHPHGAVE